MTDSIKTTIRLTKIAALVRKDIDANICIVSDPWGVMKERYNKPSHQPSAMTSTKTKWIVRCAVDPEHPEQGEVPMFIDADLNIPNATVGHNLEHGTSVFAAGVAALEQQRIWMAQSGLPRAALDLLTTADVRLRGVTITYLIRCVDRADAEKLVNSIRRTGKVLNKHCEVKESINVSVYLPYRTFTILAYIKTSLTKCKFAEGAPVDDLVTETSCLVRIEVMVGERFLTKLNLIELDSWRDAYENGVYETIFNLTVRKVLRLGKLRHKAPREEVFRRLTSTQARLLRGFLDGRNPRLFKSVVESDSPAKRFSVLRLEILEIAKIDVGIPWAEHVKLRCFELDDLLRYPGDYQPSEVHALWCFCKANWKKLRQDLRARYESALTAFLQTAGDSVAAV
jgi:hypothetical protein